MRIIDVEFAVVRPAYSNDGLDEIGADWRDEHRKFMLFIARSCAIIVLFNLVVWAAAWVCS